MDDYILIVDDIETNRAILTQLFEENYKILCAENGEQAIEYIEKYETSIAVVLLDLIMPIMDGFGVLDFMSKNKYLSSIPVILITGESRIESDEKAYSYGVADIIYKPFVARVVVRRTQNVIDLYQNKKNMERRLKEQAEELLKNAQELKENNDFLVDALSTVVEFRSLESGAHIRCIKNFTQVLLEKLQENYSQYNMDKETIDMIVRASALHDIGKIGISDAILLKPGRLTPEEFAVMKTHTTIGCDILARFNRNKENQFYKYCYEICRHHHEKWDGKGYPDGLKGDEIPLSAQIVAVADIYDALVSKRIYKDAFAHERACHMIVNGECGQLSPVALECFQLALEDFKEIAKQNSEIKIEEQRCV